MVIPSAPQNLQAEVVDGKVVYTWSPVANAAEYILYYSTAAGVAPSDTGIRWLRTVVPELIFDGFGDDVYYAVVTAVAAGGVESAPSNQVQANLDEDPVLTIDFDDEPVGSTYERRSNSDNENLLIAASDDSSNHYLSATYIPTSIGSPRLLFIREFAPGESYTLNYKVFFENGFDFARGGKLPGLGPKFPVTGCTEGGPGNWSVRLMWLPEGGISIYYYDQELADSCGNGAKSYSFRFQTGRWYDISLYVKLNSPTLSDGQITLYVDGAQVVTRANVKLRAIDGVDTEVQKLLFATFFGGSSAEWSPSSTVKSRFDDFDVYRGLKVSPPRD